MTIRHARADDLPGLQQIELAAGAVFRTVGMDAIADDDPPAIADLIATQRAGRLWVSVDAQDRPVAYVMAEVVDGTGHVDQVSVHPDHARQGLGRDLVEAVATWARGLGLAALTLTTYAEVPWNAPYYARLGFEVVAHEHLTEGLRSIRDHEAARGLDHWPRVTMRRGLRGTAPTRGE